MALIQTLNKGSDSILRTYRAKNGNITHILTNEMSGMVIGKKIINCDSFGNPQKVIDMTSKRKDVYTKAEDGSTILRKGNNIVKIAHVAFNNLCERIFK